MVELPNFETTMLLLSVALGLSFGVERLLEGLDGIIKRVLLNEDSPFAEKAPPPEQVIEDLRKRADAEAKTQAAEELEEAKAQLEFEADRLSDREKTQLENRAVALEAEGLDTSRTEQDKRFSEATVFVEKAKPKNAERSARVFWLQIVGTFAGVVICFMSNFGLFSALGVFASAPPSLDYALTGILIGAGSQPVHFLIQFITQRKPIELSVSTETEIEAAEEIKEKEAPEAPVVITRPAGSSPIIDIAYAGGVDREIMENRNRRGENPRLIVYHHTAMHSRASFADVVKVIKDKGWSTGYHCVVLADGSVHPFCRWDRFGSHAKGYNRQSLGISLNGNFEPDPNVPFANINGRMGNLRPTDAQLLSAAKVVALWCHLYDIDVDFDETVIPHKKISDKTCPGSNFPYDPFKQLVETIYERWRADPAATEELAVWEHKQYLYI